MNFTEKIMEIMEERNITAYEICKNLHISNTTFSSWKKGSKPSVDKAIEILRYLQLSADEIFELKQGVGNLSVEEQQLLDAYKNAAPGIQQATRKLLDLPETADQKAESKLSQSKIG